MRTEDGLTSRNRRAAGAGLCDADASLAHQPDRRISFAWVLAGNLALWLLLAEGVRALL
jgi:hypothetical protein